MKYFKNTFLLFLTTAISIGTVACSTPNSNESQNSESKTEEMQESQSQTESEKIQNTESQSESEKIQDTEIQTQPNSTTDSITENDSSANTTDTFTTTEKSTQEESTTSTETETGTETETVPPITNTDNLPLSDIPKFTGGKYAKTYSIGDGISQLFYTSVDKESIPAYVAQLSAFGYEKTEENEINENLFVTCYGKNGLIHLSYLKHNRSLSVILDSLNESTYKTSEPEYQKVTDVSLAVMSLDYENTEEAISENVHDASGMSYIITLEDGRYVIFDGGYWHKSSNGASRDACAIYNFLKDNNKRTDGKIVIAAWIFTHDHSDHHGAFSSFCDYGYAANVELEYYIQNFGDKSRYKQQPSGWLASGIPDLIKSNFKNAKRIIPHTGQKITFCNTTFELVSSHENHAPSLVEWINDASLIFRMETNGVKTLFLADAEAQTTRALTNMYSDTLNSDIIQVAHHGYSGGSIKFYKLINPSWSLWPTSQNCFEERTSGGGNGNAQAQNKWIRDNTICYVGDGDIEIITFVGGESKITTSTCSPNWNK